MQVIKTNLTSLQLSQIPHWLLKKIQITCVDLIDRDLYIYLTFEHPTIMKHLAKYTIC